jgi:alkylation response protein AidB-like acyl-CoA dehydrogenase
MDLTYGAEYEDFRSEVRAFLESNWPPKCDASDIPRSDREPHFRRLATDAGYLYRNVPKRFGGSEQPPDSLRAAVIGEEFARARAPREVSGNGVTMLIPTLLERGEEWQKEQFIPKTVSGEYRWAQGYSEPGSGSDLASLRTRGELSGDEWVINGQKIWTSDAMDCRGDRPRLPGRDRARLLRRRPLVVRGRRLPQYAQQPRLLVEQRVDRRRLALELARSDARLREIDRQPG